MIFFSNLSLYFQSTIQTFRVVELLRFVFIAFFPLSALVLFSTVINASSQETKKRSADLPKITYNIKVQSSEILSKDEKNLIKKEENRRVNLPDNVVDDFMERSSLKLFIKRPLYSEFALGKRSKNDIKTLRKILRFYGYYDAKVTVVLESSSEPKIEKSVTFTVALGERYKIRSFKTTFTPRGKGPAPCTLNVNGMDIEIGAFMETGVILSSFDKIKDHLFSCGYPFAKITSHRAILDQGTKVVDLRLIIAPGPFVRFGILKISGSKTVPNHFIENRSPLKKGAPYDQGKIDKYQDKLSYTDLFQHIQIRKGGKLDDVKNMAEMPININLRDGKPRTITAGVEFNTSTGIGLSSSWEHRNIFGNADRFKASAHFSKKEQALDFMYALPDFGWVDQTFTTNLEYKKEINDAFKKNGFGISFLFDNKLLGGWSYFYGLSFENYTITENGNKMRVGGVGIPLGAKLNRVNNTLNPTKGFKIIGTITPEFGSFGKIKTLTKSTLFGTYHIPLSDDHQYILSFWSRIGTVFGAKSIDIPENRRLFAGGSGSVRGYGSHKLSPLSATGKPIGGKSLIEFGIEPRIRFGKNWGVVTFVEGGAVSQTLIPSLGKNLLFGAGFGVRYYTDFGPIRADIAIPFKKRKNAAGKRIDSAIQFYISIGQAF